MDYYQDNRVDYQPPGSAGDGNNGTYAEVDNALLQLNGHDRFAARDFRYFTRTQVWQHHNGFGGVSNADSFAVYSFLMI